MLGGLHFTMFAIYTSSLFSPTALKALSINCPALPTNGSPNLSSSAPGPSPISIIFAFLFPTPNTIFCLAKYNLHLLHPCIDFSKSSQLSNILIPHF